MLFDVDRRGNLELAEDARAVVLRTPPLAADRPLTEDEVRVVRRGAPLAWTFLFHLLGIVFPITAASEGAFLVGMALWAGWVALMAIPLHLVPLWIGRRTAAGLGDPPTARRAVVATTVRGAGKAQRAVVMVLAEEGPHDFLVATLSSGVPRAYLGRTEWAWVAGPAEARARLAVIFADGQVAVTGKTHAVDLYGRQAMVPTFARAREASVEGAAPTPAAALGVDSSPLVPRWSGAAAVGSGSSPLVARSSAVVPSVVGGGAAARSGTAASDAGTPVGGDEAGTSAPELGSHPDAPQMDRRSRYERPVVAGPRRPPSTAAKVGRVVGLVVTVVVLFVRLLAACEPEPRTPPIDVGRINLPETVTDAEAVGWLPPELRPASTASITYASRQGTATASSIAFQYSDLTSRVPTVEALQLLAEAAGFATDPLIDGYPLVEGVRPDGSTVRISVRDDVGAGESEVSIFLELTSG